MASERPARHIYEGMEKGVAALQFLQRANNIGKVVISSPSRPWGLEAVPFVLGAPRRVQGLRENCCWLRLTLQPGAAGLPLWTEFGSQTRALLSLAQELSLFRQMPLLSGGLGALGVVTAQFLVEEGAKALCLLSRNGQPAKARQVHVIWGDGIGGQAGSLLQRY